MKNFLTYTASILAIPLVCCATLFVIGATTPDGPSPNNFAEIKQMDGRVITVQVARISEPRTGLLRIVTTDGLTFETSPINVLLRSAL